MRAIAFILGALCAAGAAHAQTQEGATLAASLRLRVESTNADLLGSSGPPQQAALLSRALASGDWRGESGWRAFVQVGWHQQTGRGRGPTPTDVNDPDFQQVFVVAPLMQGASLTVGRQELVLGSARLVGARDGPNIRLAFDGAVLDANSGAWRTRAFALAPVEIRTDAFDDRADPDTRLYGAYATRTASEGAPSLDLYALHLERKDVPFSSMRADESRTTLGVRVFGRRGAFDYNIEPMAQLGAFGDQDIRAWTIASDFGWTVRSWRLSPRFGLKADITSGDGDPNDGALETFNPLVPNFGYFSDAPTLSPQNHMDLQPEITLQITPELSLRGGIDFFWRTSTEDAVYRPPGTAIPNTAGRPGRFTAVQPELEVRWRPNHALDLRASLIGWAPGDALSAAGAEDGFFAMISLTRSF